MNRRDLLKLAAVAPLVATWPGSAQSAVDATGLREGETFSRDALEVHARERAKTAYVAPDASLPAPFQTLDAKQYAAIRFREDRAIWSAERRGFAVEPLHRGFVFAMPVDLYSVEDGRVLRIPYTPSMFDFGDLPAPPADTDIGFSGFRLVAAGATPGSYNPFAIFQGATFFRAIAANQTFGPVARGLAIDTGGINGEEFPFFRAFWIERPEGDSRTLIVHALLDTEATTGAYHLTLHPGETTTMEVECVLYPRKKIEHVGIATTNAMYFFGANDRLGVDDVRLAAHDAAGLQIWNGSGEWIWRPVQNPGTLQISAFLDNSPRAFGLLQRNRDVAAFEDDTHHYERMPSVWVEPLDAWGEGSVQLVEIPTDSDINDNIVAYWRPKAALEAGGAFGFRYRLSWCWRPSQVPPLAIVAATRVGNGGSRRREFAIDFVGEIFRDRARSEAVKSAVSAAPGKIVEVTRFVMPERGMMRLLVVLDTDAQPFSELRAQLLEGETPASETWLYRWIA